ncbi:arrestin domain-containing protein 17 [Drosophila guanche]|uniref:Blast:Arrestin domain-containing protein 2 n=1 Tax=Drosophila guanche TaxID=7266 RepID=A0A3B0KCZ0_DROGU|nr:arrestin domain-containing protein 17 [Drosophila guanche]SPP84079.1 blast:Arrestin domain-containing protein 2 [Drosophila guanche]
MSKNCMITFDQNEHGTYFTGQVITGKVIVNLTKTKKLRGIKLQISGYALAQWRVRRRGKAMPIQNPKKRTKHLFSGREDYIASTTYLMGSEQGSCFNIDAGTYTYTFACPIPSHCPSSFEGSYGHIRYLAKVTFLKAGASNRTHNVGFTVLKLLDLNQESKMLREPASNEALEYFCMLHTHPVELKVTLQQQGYVPGQFMLIHAQVRNDSSSDCKKLLIMIHLRATYTADQPSLRTTSEKIMLVKRECGPVAHHSQKIYTETLRIPATAPTCEHLSKVVRVSYEVRVVAVMNWLMSNPRVVIPITIGNVPLSTAGPSFPETPLPSDLPCTSTRAMELAQMGMGGVNNSGYERSESLEDFELPEDGDDELDTSDEFVADLPPPTYEQAIFMSTDIADTDANTVSEASQFTPRYPVFDVDTFQTPPPNPPQKKRRRRRRRPAEPGHQNTANPEKQQLEKQPVESPVQI